MTGESIGVVQGDVEGRRLLRLEEKNIRKKEEGRRGREERTGGEGGEGGDRGEEGEGGRRGREEREGGEGGRRGREEERREEEGSQGGREAETSFSPLFLPFFFSYQYVIDGRHSIHSSPPFPLSYVNLRMKNK